MRILVILLSLTLLLVRPSLGCTELEEDCDSTEVSVTVSVLDSLGYEQIQPMSFGQVSRSEYVSVSLASTQTRGRQRGILDITADYNEQGIQVSCISASSYVAFNTGNEILDSCILKEDGSNQSGSSVIMLNQVSGSTLVHRVFVGGSIYIPNSQILQDTTHSGVIRIQVDFL